MSERSARLGRRPEDRRASHVSVLLLAVALILAAIPEVALLMGGACPGGAGKVLKKIIAVPGDRVSLDAHGLHVNGLSVPGTEPTAADNRGRPLEPLELNESVIPVKSYWVGGTNPARSWDSRYFGPVRRDLIVARARPLFLLGNDSTSKR